MPWLLATIYDRFMQSTERACIGRWREELLASVRGDVLEIGAGTGRNLDYYRGVSRLALVEPDMYMRRKLQKRDVAPHVADRVEIAASRGERLAFADASFDVVVSTLVLCSVRDPALTLAEIRRVLRPGGRFVFLEHVLSEREGRRRWQRRLQPLWMRVADNCHLCRDTATSIEAAGFEFESIERESMRKAPPMIRETIRGVACPAPRVERAAR